MTQNLLQILLLLLFISFFNISQINSHGMLLDPVARSSRWHYNSSAPINYDDNGLNCGGYGVSL